MSQLNRTGSCAVHYYQPDRITDASVGLRGALHAATNPFIGIHLFSIFAREEFRTQGAVFLGFCCGCNFRAGTSRVRGDVAIGHEVLAPGYLTGNL